MELSLQEYVTSSSADIHTGLLLDGADRINDDLKHLNKRIKLLEKSSIDPKKKSAIQTCMDRYGSGTSSYSDPPNLDIPLPVPDENRGTLGEKVQKLTTQVHQIIAEANESAISFGGLGLKSVHEVDSWLVANPYASRHYGLCPDAMIFLEWVADDMSKGEKITEQLRKLKKLGLATAAEARACDSFAYALPRVFAGEGGNRSMLLINLTSPQ